MKKSLVLSLLMPFSIACATEFLPQNWNHENKSCYINYENKTYNAELIRKENKKSWLIYENKNLIGDDKNEIKLYEKLAFTATISNFNNNNKEYPETLRKISKDFIAEANNYELSYVLPKFIFEFGSELEGKIANIYFFGGGRKALSQTSKTREIIEKEIIKKAFNEVKKEYMENNGLNKKNKLELAKILIKKVKESEYCNLVNAAEKLNKAAKIEEKTEEWDYETASEFYNNWKSGYMDGLAHLTYLNSLNKNRNFDFITETIIRKFGKEFTGISEDKINELEKLFFSKELENLTKEENIFDDFEYLYNPENYNAFFEDLKNDKAKMAEIKLYEQLDYDYTTLRVVPFYDRYLICSINDMCIKDGGTGTPIEAFLVDKDFNFIKLKGYDDGTIGWGDVYHTEINDNSIRIICKKYDTLTGDFRFIIEGNNYRKINLGHL